MSQHYVGLDVSLDLVHICVVDEDGVPVWRGKCAVCPATIARHLREHAPHLVRAGLETGQFAPWLTLQLRRRKIRTLCIDARHAYAALKLQRNKTDAGDALGLAQIIRTGWYREEWGLRIAARSSMRKAKVAVAHKLAVILHRIWVSENEFNAAPAAV